jgi:hypothetical protein
MVFKSNNTTPMNNTTPLTKCEVQELVNEFYTKLDAHAPVEEYINLFAFEDEGLVLQFPGSRLTNWEQFKPWYESTLNKFFDEIHTAEKIELTTNNEQANIQAIVHWEATTWEPPHAHSNRIVASVNQSWVVIRSAKTQKPVFKQYIVDKINYS